MEKTVDKEEIGDYTVSVVKNRDRYGTKAFIQSESWMDAFFD